ncbi:MAG: NUDIX hydrolase [Alphaproteobacteria bacterium]|jgi:ADP-ribose pyrophosphatase
MAKPSPWKVTESRILHDGQPWLTLHAETVQLPDGREVAPYFRIDMRDFAIVHATAKAGEVLVLNLYRHGPRRIELALPGGLIDDGETPLVAAQRELMEETGYHATNWRTLGSYIMNSNYGCGRCHVFMASEAEQVAEPDSGDLEDAELLLMPPEDLLGAVGQGRVGVMGHAAAIAMVTAAKVGFPVKDCSSPDSRT